MQSGSARLMAVGVGLVALIASTYGVAYLLGSRGLVGGFSSSPSEAALVAAVRSALAEPNQLTRAAELLPGLEALGPRDLAAVVSAFEDTFVSVGPGSVALELLCARWASLDPQGALERILGWRTYPYYRRLGLSHLMRSWARNDPAAARRGLDAIEPTLPSAVTEAFIEGWSESQDPEIWEAYVAGLPFGRESAEKLIQRLMAREGVEALVARVEALPDDSGDDGFKQEALQRVVMVAARTDIERATALVERYLNSPLGEGLPAGLGRWWVARDGARAMEWLESLPREPGGRGALRTAYRRWTVIDPDAALAWLEARPDGDLPEIHYVYVGALANSDPERAAALAERLPEERRERALRQVGRAWLAQDPKAAQAFIERNGLGPEIARPGMPKQRQRARAAGGTAQR